MLGDQGIDFFEKKTFFFYLMFTSFLINLNQNKITNKSRNFTTQIHKNTKKKIIIKKTVKQKQNKI